MKVYLAGPMTGIPEFNFPAFKAATEDLRQRGYDVLSPAEMDEAEGFEPSPTGDDQAPEQYAAFLARDIQKIAEANIDAIVVLPGWETSGGANTEVAFVRALKRPVLRYPELTEIDRAGDPVVEIKADLTDLRAQLDRQVGEVRVVNEKTGGAKGSKPQRLELLPPEALERIAEVYAFGAQKYAPNNWLRGYDWSLSYGALQRHLNAFWRGEDLDPETGLTHLAHAGFHVLALLVYLVHPDAYGEFDDRPRIREVEEVAA